MSEVRVNNLSNENNTGGPTISGITTYSGRHFFVPPVGTTAQRPEDCEPGSLRFNTDTAHLEYFRGDTIGWTEIEAESSELGGGTSSSNKNSLGARGITGGSHVYGRTIEFFTVTTAGDSQDFGDLTEAAGYSNGKSVATTSKMLFAGGYYKNAIEFITVATTGNSQDFGDLTVQRLECSSCNDTIRGIWAGGQGPGHSAVNTMDYVSISSSGNAEDFGDLVQQKTCQASSNSSTRGFWRRSNSPLSPTATFDSVILRSTGNAVNFFDMANNETTLGGGGCNATRGIYAGGYITNNMHYINLHSTGDSIDFGDQYQRAYSGTSATSSTRYCHVGGTNYVNVDGSHTYPAINVIQTVQFATLGNTVDFGDMAYLTNNKLAQGNSNEHGGI